MSSRVRFFLARNSSVLFCSCCNWASLLQQGIKTKFSYYSPVWQDISDEAKNLINRMLKYPPDQRISAMDSYSHDWIKKKKFNQLRPETAHNLLTNLKNFHTEQKLQQAALMYIVTQLMGKKEKEDLKQTFMALDKNADGKLSREELIEGYTTLYGSVEQAIKEATAIEDRPTVIVVNGACVFTPQFQRRPVVAVDLEACNGCGFCFRVGCPAILKAEEVDAKTKRPKAEIDPLLCTGCTVCLQVCPREAMYQGEMTNEQ